MGLKVGAKAKVAAEATSKSGKPMLRLKISRKENEKWVIDFDGWVHIGGNCARKPPKKGDLIKIVACDLKTIYGDNANAPKFLIYLFDYEYIMSFQQDDIFEDKKFGEPAMKYHKEVPPTDLPF